MDTSLRNVAKRKWMAKRGYGVAAEGDTLRRRITRAAAGTRSWGVHLYNKLHGTGDRLDLLSDPYRTRPDGEPCKVLSLRDDGSMDRRSSWYSGNDGLTKARSAFAEPGSAGRAKRGSGRPPSCRSLADSLSAAH
jgi:hypothetical protein